MADLTRRVLMGLGALGAVGALGVYVAGRLHQADLPPPTGDFITVDDVRLHYRIDGSGPKAIAIHGASGNLRDWTAGPARAIFDTATVLTFDRPGLGYSDRPPGGEDPFVQARLMARAAAELGFNDVPLIGHSFGGAVALAWALQSPGSVSGLVLLAAPSQVWPGPTGRLYALGAHPVIGPVVSRIIPAVASDKLITDGVARVFAPQPAPDGYADALAARLSLVPQVAQNNARDIDSLKPVIREMVPRYGTLDLPVELLHGTADKVVPLDVHSVHLVHQIPGARLTELPGQGHMIHHTASDQMVAALRRLLDGA